eukprot:6121073-Pyramimonas_sp.AAC.1
MATCSTARLLEFLSWTSTAQPTISHRSGRKLPPIRGRRSRRPRTQGGRTRRTRAVARSRSRARSARRRGTKRSIGTSSKKLPQGGSPAGSPSAMRRVS